MQNFSNARMTASDWHNITHFTPAEFRAPDLMSADFMLWLDRVRTMARVPMRITSSYRTPAHNTAIGGAEHSAHMDIPCMAVDILPIPTPFDPHGNQARFAIVTSALNLGCTRIGLYKDGSIHLDMSDRIKRVLWHVVDNPA